jgi:hypothetical protein
MKPAITMRAALSDPALLGATLGGPSWLAWRVLLIAAMGEPLLADELALFTRLTGRTEPPAQRVEEFLAVAGRRGGKSRAMAALAAYIAGLCDHRHVLAPGEKPMLLAIAPDQRQARIDLDYAEGVFLATPIMKQLVKNRTADSLELKNGVAIEVRAASFRRLRGVTCLAVLADEASFWHSDEASSNADTEILNAVRPSLATTGGLLAVISSPYAKRGEVWSTYRAHFGPDGDPQILVAQGASREFNPSLSERVVERALERDRAAATAEYLALFRDDIESFVSIEIVEACVERGVPVRPPLSGIQYRAFVDMSGGVSDSATLAISHSEGERVVIDATREVKAPHSPEGVVDSFAETLRHYRVSTVRGDKYAGEWPREQFRKRGIGYEPADKSRSDLYRDLLPMLTSGLITLPDNPRLVSQISQLERRTSRTGRDIIDHAPGASDDVANAAAGAASLACGPRHFCHVEPFRL